MCKTSRKEVQDHSDYLQPTKSPNILSIKQDESSSPIKIIYLIQVIPPDSQNQGKPGSSFVTAY